MMGTWGGGLTIDQFIINNLLDLKAAASGERDTHTNGLETSIPLTLDVCKGPDGGPVLVKPSWSLFPQRS